MSSGWVVPKGRHITKQNRSRRACWAAVIVLVLFIRLTLKTDFKMC